MHREFDQLKKYTDIASLRAALHALCSRYGSVVQLHIFAAHQAGKRQALCFLRMGSAAQEQQLTSQLGVGRFGGALVVIVDLCMPVGVSGPLLGERQTMNHGIAMMGSPTNAASTT